jgi:protein ImuB
MFACLSLAPAKRGLTPPRFLEGSNPFSLNARSTPEQALNDRSILEQIARDFSPRVELPSPDSVVLDISGLDRLIGEPHAIGCELQRAIRRADAAESAAVHIAIAPTRISARLIARAEPGLTIVARGNEASCLARLPAQALVDLGAPDDLLVTLDRWGVKSLGAFASLPSPALSARLGQDGVRWQRLARGEDPAPLVPSIPDERFETVFDLEWPVEGLEPLSFVLGRLLDPLCARLEVRDRAVAALTLQLREAVSREWHRRRLELPAPMRDVRVLRTLLCLDLEGHPLDGGIDRVGLFIEPTPGRVCQFSLLATPTLAPEQAATLMARLRALMGQDRCGVPELVDTHRPGAFSIGEFSPSSRPPTRALNSGPRSFFQRSPSLRRLRHPIPARVVLEDKRPVRVVTDRRGWNGGKVLWCAGPWRSSGDWWKPSAEPWNHEGWDVALSDGGLYRIHQDRLSQQWFVEAVVD